MSHTYTIEEAKSEFIFQFEEVGACPICGSPDRTPRATLPGIATKDKVHEIHYQKCTACGHVYMDPRPDDKTLEALYSTGSYRGLLGSMRPDLANFTDETWRGIRISSLLVSMRDEGIIDFNSAIDIGGSTGALLYILATGIIKNKKHKLTKLLNVELNPQFSIWGRAKGILDVRTMKQAAVYAPFDLVTCVHVLEHTNHPREFLAEVVSMGKSGSAYYIEVPTVRKGALGIFHAQAFPSEILITLCQDLGLEVIRAGVIAIEDNEPKEHMVVARKP